MELEIFINLEDETLEQAMDLKCDLAEAIEESKSGEVTGSGIGFGQIDLSVEVVNSPAAIASIRKTLLLMSLSERAEIIVSGEDN